MARSSKTAPFLRSFTFSLDVAVNNLTVAKFAGFNGTKSREEAMASQDADGGRGLQNICGLTNY